MLAVGDIFAALTADGPSRAGMPVPDALAILRKDVGTAVDVFCVAALEAAVSRLDGVRHMSQPSAAAA